VNDNKSSMSTLFLIIVFFSSSIYGMEVNDPTSLPQKIDTILGIQSINKTKNKAKNKKKFQDPFLDQWQRLSKSRNGTTDYVDYGSDIEELTSRQYTIPHIEEVTEGLEEVPKNDIQLQKPDPEQLKQTVNQAAFNLIELMRNNIKSYELLINQQCEMKKQLVDYSKNINSVDQQTEIKEQVKEITVSPKDIQAQIDELTNQLENLEIPAIETQAEYLNKIAQHAELLEPAFQDQMRDIYHFGGCMGNMVFALETLAKNSTKFPSGFDRLEEAWSVSVEKKRLQLDCTFFYNLIKILYPKQDIPKIKKEIIESFDNEIKNTILKNLKEKYDLPAEILENIMQTKEISIEKASKMRDDILTNIKDQFKDENIKMISEFKKNIETLLKDESSTNIKSISVLETVLNSYKKRILYLNDSHDVKKVRQDNKLLIPVTTREELQWLKEILKTWSYISHSRKDFIRSERSYEACIINIKDTLHTLVTVSLEKEQKLRVEDRLVCNYMFVTIFYAEERDQEGKIFKIKKDEEIKKEVIKDLTKCYTNGNAAEEYKNQCIKKFNDIINDRKTTINNQDEYYDNDLQGWRYSFDNFEEWDKDLVLFFVFPLLCVFTVLFVKIIIVFFARRATRIAYQKAFID
jgi:hypothetical protein